MIQKGSNVKVEVRRTQHKGWGLFSLQEIPKGSFVVEYVGELIDNDEAEKRGRKYGKAGCSFLFDLDYAVSGDDCFSLDAQYYGNEARFINHSFNQ